MITRLVVCWIILTLKIITKWLIIDLSKQQVFDANPRAIQQNNFPANLDRRGNTAIFFIIEEALEPVLDLSQESLKSL